MIQYSVVQCLITCLYWIGMLSVRPNMSPTRIEQNLIRGVKARGQKGGPKREVKKIRILRKWGSKSKSHENEAKKIELGSKIRKIIRATFVFPYSISKIGYNDF